MESENQRKNKNEYLKDFKFIYNDKKMITKDTLKKCIEDKAGCKVKVHVTKDEKIIIINDKILKELKDKKIEIQKITYDEYLKMAALEEGYVLLKDLLSDLRNLNDDFNIYIEILIRSKKNYIEKAIIEEVNTYGLRAIISSKIPSVIKYFKKKAPNVIRGIKFESYDSEDIKLSFFEKRRTKKVKYPRSLDIDFIEYDINCIPNMRLMNARGRNNVKVMANLIDTESKMNKAKVYADIFVLKEELEEELN